MSVGKLRTKLNKQWPAIAKASAAAEEQLQRLKTILQDQKIDSEDISIVVFGSLARREWTSGSDLDWTMLIDGEADHEHVNTAHKFRNLLEKEKFRRPGATRSFGTLTFSHEVIHQIGGLDDTNRNTTQRLLLLLESVPCNRREAYDRVIRAVLRRYLQNDFREFRLKVPRFLLNDLHRFWRTMCVDYANKYREQAGEKWALRNIKLRMSRKLIFAAGLLTCYSCDGDWIKVKSPSLAAAPSVEGLVEYLTARVHQTPLDLLADVLAASEQGSGAIIFESYNAFLEYLSEDTNRQHLEKLAPEAAGKDPDFCKVQSLSRDFERGLEDLFFDNGMLAPLTRTYGVF